MVQWPWSSPTTSRKESDKWTESANVTDWRHYTDPRNLIPVILLTATCIGSYSFYRSYLRRIPQASLIQPAFYRRRSLFGRVTSVGDGDNFRLFHTPGGRLAGWGWLPGRMVPKERVDLKDKTVGIFISLSGLQEGASSCDPLFTDLEPQIHIRLAGVDAPELAHFGRPSQPLSQEAIDWLTAFVLHRRVRAYVYKRDQYDRAVATVYVRRGLLRRDVGLQMLRMGLATVYEAKTGAEFGKLEEKYRSAERWAKLKRKGIWGLKKGEFESPREYKTRMGPAT